MAKFHNITVKPDGKEFRLYNNGAVCGPRLIKGGVFPITAFKFKLEKDANTAAGKLQKYLDADEDERSKKKTKTKSATGAE